MLGDTGGVSEQANLDVVRRAIEGLRESYASGEASPALLELSAPDIPLDASRRIFNPEVYDGHDGMRTLIREICDAWEGFTETTERLIPVGDRVVAIQRISARGRASMVDVEATGAVVWTVSDGLVVRVDVFN